MGLLLQVPIRIAAKMQVGERVSFHTYLIVREDALTLYGFTEIVDRDFFELLLSVTGIGPKVAQSILANSDAASIANAIITSNLKSLEAVPGLGKKGAQRLVLELKDRIGTPTSGAKRSSSKESQWQIQVEQGLLGLGWSPRDAQRAITAVIDEGVTDSQATSELLRRALQILAGA